MKLHPDFHLRLGRVQAVLDMAKDQSVTVQNYASVLNPLPVEATKEQVERLTRMTRILSRLTEELQDSFIPDKTHEH